ncbi:MAG: hypothetical protein ACRCRP_03350 [Metamycoplasmataceae bacterium]
MSKKFILWSCLTASFLSLASMSTIFVLISVKRNYITNNKNLKINSFPGITNISEKDINTIISMTEPINDRVLALSKLFEGVNEKNINNFTVEQISNETITLIANETYFFNSEDIKTLSANYKLVKILNIKAKEGINIISSADIEIITSTTNQPKDRVAILSKLFDGVTEENVNNFKVEKTSNSEITLIANDGFSFGLETFPKITVDIKFIEVLNVMVNPGINFIISEDLDAIVSTTNQLKDRVAALNKIFKGVTEQNINNFKVEKTSSSKITLIANEGFGFGISIVPQISSEIEIVQILNIKNKSGIINITQDDIDIITSTTNQLKDRVAALSKLFDGVTEQNINNFKVEKTLTSVTLKANEGFVFTSLATSLTINIKIVTILPITAKPGINNITNSDIVDMIAITIPIKNKVIALSKVFNGITEENAVNVTIKKPSDTVLILIANEGFVFNSSLATSLPVNIKIV